MSDPMTSDLKADIPLCIYVAWHPRCERAAELASRVYHWFHTIEDGLEYIGVGLPVYFRGEGYGPRKEGDAPTTPPQPIDHYGARWNVVIPLVDEHFASDPLWRKWLRDTRVDPISDHKRKTALERPRRAEFIPVALHPSAYQIPSLEGINFLRFADDKGQSEAGSNDDPVQDMIRRIGDVLCRLLLRDQPGKHKDVAPRVSVFISHAKRDGRDIALSLKAAIEEHAQLEPWFDEADLPTGAPFGLRIDNAAGADTAAVIAVVTDEYAHRPWCRRELALARTPRPIPRDNGKPHERRWRVQPVVAIDALEGRQTRGIPELGNVPTVRWRPDEVKKTLDRVVREILLSLYHQRLGIPSEAGEQDKELEVTWAPDIPTIMQFARQRQARQRRYERIIYPGHGVTDRDRVEMEGLLNGLLNRKSAPLTLLSLEDHLYTRKMKGERTGKRPDPLKPALRHAVALLASQPPARDLRRRSMGQAHFSNYVLRLARALLHHEVNIAYGGTLPSPSGGRRKVEITELLAQTIDSLRDRRKGTAPPEGALPSERARLINYQAWPFHTRLNEDTIASALGVTRYVCIDSDPSGPGTMGQRPVRNRDPVPEWDGPWKGGNLKTAQALTRMRRVMFEGHAPESKNKTPYLAEDGLPVKPVAAAIAIGGQLEGTKGFMPGIIEEICIALEARVPIYIIGGYGGAAGAVAELLLTRWETGDDGLPDIPDETKHRLFPALKGSESKAFDTQARAHSEKAFNVLRELTHSRTTAWDNGTEHDSEACGLNNGLSWYDNEPLLWSHLWSPSSDPDADLGDGQNNRVSEKLRLILAGLTACGVLPVKTEEET